jgi:hypothetical protein
MKDALDLHDLLSGRVDFKLFLDPDYKDLVANSHYIDKTYAFPPWEKEELRKLLAKRIGLHQEGFTNYSDDVEKINPNEASITPDLHRRLQETLLNSGFFESGKKLRAIFIDTRINPWRNRLPEANDLQERVLTVIEFMHSKRNDLQENALVLLLRVLSDNIPIGDACHSQLSKLAKELEYEQQSTQTPSEVRPSRDYTSNWAQQIPLKHLTPNAKEKFIDLIVGESLHANPDNEGLDAPIHALRLARGLLAACSGCWERYSDRALEVADLEEIIDLYWRGER